jgi:uncharacterized membrane protein YccC
VLAWTEREGPGRGPGPSSRRLWYLLAGAMSVVLFGIMSSDTLCPEHRMWVLLLGAASLIAAGTAVVGLIDGWAGAPLLAMASALGGVGIGLIDAVHSPSRGRLIALGFGAAFAVACALVWRQRRQHRWDRSVARSLRPIETSLPEQMPAPTSPPATRTGAPGSAVRARS